MRRNVAGLLNRGSLYLTLDAVAEALFFEEPIAAARRKEVARWIAGRQGLPGSYAGMFAPTEKDKLGIRLFTGEAIRTRAALAHILGEESCRILALLRVDDRSVQSALVRAVGGLRDRIETTEQRGYAVGFYCCGACTAAYWRNLANGLLPRSEERLRLGLAELKRLRTGAGQWRRFPFDYTSLVLTEIGPDLARDEMEYAAGRWQRRLKKLEQANDRLSLRKAAVGRRLLELSSR